MACFIVPLTQAVATTIYRKVTKQTDTFVGRNLKTLELMLWGGSIMLLIDHLVNGELFAWNLREVLTIGVPMSVVVTAVWAIWCYAKERKELKVES
ncbi:MAG: hypothetical protein IJ047_06260 [Paludibacteraceae bacterium]|jgi:ACR3 family arsenite efflux pump ArsB|nr:hypothetical protein [Paludibacteraceae bacterium]